MYRWKAVHVFCIDNMSPACCMFPWRESWKSQDYSQMIFFNFVNNKKKLRRKKSTYCSYEKNIF